jgi:hypothetical protein
LSHLSQVFEVISSKAARWVFLVDAFLAAQLRDALLAAQPRDHNPDLFFGRILPPCRAPDIPDDLFGFF